MSWHPRQTFLILKNKPLATSVFFYPIVNGNLPEILATREPATTTTYYRRPESHPTVTKREPTTLDLRFVATATTHKLVNQQPSHDATQPHHHPAPTIWFHFVSFLLLFSFIWWVDLIFFFLIKADLNWSNELTEK